MKRLILTVTAAGLVTAAAGMAATSQSLAEVAERDRQRRAREGKPAKTYTDSDLKASPEPLPSPSPSPSPITWQGAPPPQGAAGRSKGWKAPTAPSPTPVPPGSAATPPVPEPPDRSEVQRAALEAQWRAIASQRREALTRTEAQIRDLEARITALRNDLSPVGLGDPNRQQTMQDEIARAQRDLDAARATLVAARQAVENLEDDARRAGALPGWVR